MTVPAELDLSPLRLPAAETELLRLLLGTGACGSREAATALGLSISQVSHAVAGLRDRGFLVPGEGRAGVHVLAPLGPAMAALVEARSDAAEADLAGLEQVRRALGAVDHPQPEGECPHSVTPRDLRDWYRVRVEGRQAYRRVDVLADRFHVNGHVPPHLDRRNLGLCRVRLLVAGVQDDRPLVITPLVTDARMATRGVEVRRMSERSAAFTVYDEKRIEVPMWRHQTSGWSTEPGEVRSAVRLFELLWSEATPYRPVVGSAA